jgi:two-component system, OmpR family, alkaline phosphatase synthesis response regulator PhoP
VAAVKNMTRVLMITRDSGTKEGLRKNLAQHDLACSFTSDDSGIGEAIAGERPDIILFEVDGQQPRMLELISSLKNSENLPVIALVAEEWLDRVDTTLDADDFLVGPYEVKELLIRINRVLRKIVKNESSERIKCGGLTIDLATCEVTIEGRLVELTFKEYELLKLLAGNKGRVFTREALLDKIWGYDYYGGDRTVDVHVRRLRSKIEDASHTYIETVRNIGYRFVKDNRPASPPET